MLFCYRFGSISNIIFSRWMAPVDDTRTTRNRREFILGKIKATFGEDIAASSMLEQNLIEFWKTRNNLMHAKDSRVIMTMDHARFIVVCHEIKTGLAQLQQSHRH